MKAPVHNCKTFMYSIEPVDVDPPIKVVKSKRFWLGSGILDKNGVEIFEGGKVIFGEQDLHGVVIFKDGMFQIAYSCDGETSYCILGHVKDFLDIEVVGHIAEEG